MTQVRARPDPAAGGGHALLRVGGAAAAVADPRFRIMLGEGERANLGPGGWQAATALLSPLGASAEGPDLVLHLGPEVVDALEPGTVLFALPAAGIDEFRLIWPTDIPTSSEGSPPPSREPEPPAPGPAPSPPQVPPAPPPPPPPPPPPLPEVVRSRFPLWLVLGLVVLVALLAGGAWFYLHPRPMRHPLPPGLNARPPVVPVPVAPPAKQAACGSGSVVQVLACATTGHELYEIGRQRWTTDPNAAFEILQSAIDRKSAHAAYFLALRYDPVGFKPGGPIAKPEPREAALDYRIAVHAKIPGAAEHRAALKAWLEARAKAGGVMAPLTLHDFWSTP